jgi:hypothetical protein
MPRPAKLQGWVCLLARHMTAELARMSALFQVRTIAAAMGDETPEVTLTDDGVEYRFSVLEREENDDGEHV